MERFSKITLNVRNMNPKVVIHRMVTTLRHGPFLDKLCKKQAANMDELWQRVTKFMQLEELKEFINQLRAEENPARRNDRDRNIHSERGAQKPEIH